MCILLTCRELLHLDSFRGVSVVAGHSGLDNVISWPYPKHTKVVSPWVRGGEFILVSGYEYGVNDSELIALLDEAEMNHLSGIMVEGGINFKTLSRSVTDHADQLGVPLFFASRVVSFLDICREISNAILESSLYDKYASSLLKKLVSDDSLSQKEVQLLFKEADVPSDCIYQVFLFAIIPQSIHDAPDASDYGATMLGVLNALQNACNASLNAMRIKPIVYPGASSAAYMVYGRTESDFAPILELMEHTRGQFSHSVKGSNLVLASSCITENILEIGKAYQQAFYTSSLLRGGLLAGNVYSFSDLGSYQLPFYIEDKAVLFAFRDRYLKELSENEQLLATLRAYITFGGNMLRTAEALYIHRNTLSYRIERIESILKKKLSDPEVYRDVLNALMILDIYPYGSK